MESMIRKKKKLARCKPSRSKSINPQAFYGSKNNEFSDQNREDVNRAIDKFIRRVEGND